jgi:hypothetical protein
VNLGIEEEKEAGRVNRKIGRGEKSLNTVEGSRDRQNTTDFLA